MNLAKMQAPRMRLQDNERSLGINELPKARMKK